ncbi:LCP family protein [Bacillus sp. DJP31]|uniref:LCP family glycopolymer transferase n=1 Tax=Bacillus sp. DJP31 TaxID=3409789 RepID=UPI003BB5D772
MTNTRSNKLEKKRKSKWFRVILTGLVVFFLFLGLFVYKFYSDIVKAVDTMHKPISRDVSDKREEQVEFEVEDPISILLVGVDKRDGDSGRTDSMLVMTINPEKESTKILSIPRDTRTRLIDKEKPKNSKYDKINHAYAFGGIEMSIDTVEEFLNVPIDYYVQISMEGFKDIVDAVGGIDVVNEHSFELDGTYLSKGPHHLDGEEALQYARMRKEDPLGDFGRQARQREVISKVIGKGASISSVANYEDILIALQNNIETNLTLDQMVDIQFDYKPAAENIEKLEIEGEVENRGKSYVIVEDTIRQALSDELRTHLGIPTSAVSKFSK